MSQDAQELTQAASVFISLASNSRCFRLLVSVVIRGSFVCGECALAAATTAAAVTAVTAVTAAPAASASLVFWLSSSHRGLLVACVILALSLLLQQYYSYDMIPRVKNLHATQLYCRRSNSGVRCKPSSYSSAACGSFVTRGGFHHLMLLRANCCCCEVRAAGRAFSYLLPVQRAKRHVPYLS